MFILFDRCELRYVVSVLFLRFSPKHISFLSVFGPLWRILCVCLLMFLFHFLSYSCWISMALHLFGFYFVVVVDRINFILKWMLCNLVWLLLVFAAFPPKRLIILIKWKYELFSGQKSYKWEHAIEYIMPLMHRKKWNKMDFLNPRKKKKRRETAEKTKIE